MVKLRDILLGLILAYALATNGTSIFVEEGVYMSTDSVDYTLADNQTNNEGLYLDGALFEIDRIQLELTKNNTATTTAELDYFNVTDIQLNITPVDGTPTIFTINVTNLTALETAYYYKNGVLKDSGGVSANTFVSFTSDTLDTLTQLLITTTTFIRTKLYGCDGVINSDESDTGAGAYNVSMSTGSNVTYNCRFELLNNTATTNLKQLCPWYTPTHYGFNYTYANYGLDYTIVRPRYYNDTLLCNMSVVSFNIGTANETTTLLEFQPIPPFGVSDGAISNNSYKLLYKKPEKDTDIDIDI